MNIERIKHLVTNLLTGSSSTSERTELAKWINSETPNEPAGKHGKMPLRRLTILSKTRCGMKYGRR